MQITRTNVTAALENSGSSARHIPSFGERVGEALGAALAPVTALVSAARGARTFHPEGTVLRGRVVASPHDPRFEPLARRLEGPMFARLSSAMWRGGREWPDVLGVGLRFRRTEDNSATPRPGDQDLLFATIRSPLTTLLAPLSTDPHDFFANDYYAVSPFHVEGFGRAKFRLVSPSHARFRGASREERLERAMDSELSVFELEALPLESAGATGDASWVRVARVELIERMDLDQAALRFSPFRNGRGIVPVGFVHALRRGAYAGSQLGRATTEGQEAGVLASLSAKLPGR